MRFKYHFIIGFVVSCILVQFFNFSPLSGLVIFLSSWLIDGDHYLWYVFEFKDWNPIHAIKWYIKSIPKWKNLSRKEKEKFKQGVFVCHGIEFWSILIALSFSHEFFLWVLIGVTIHMIADWIDLIKRGESLYNKLSFYYVIKKNKNKKGLKEL